MQHAIISSLDDILGRAMRENHAQVCTGLKTWGAQLGSVQLVAAPAANFATVRTGGRAS